MCKCPRILPRNLTTENNLIVDFHIFLTMYLLFMVIGKLTLVQSFTFFASKCRIPLVINDTSLLIFFYRTHFPYPSSPFRIYKKWQTPSAHYSSECWILLIFFGL